MKTNRPALDRSSRVTTARDSRRRTDAARCAALRWRKGLIGTSLVVMIAGAVLFGEIVWPWTRQAPDSAAGETQLAALAEMPRVRFTDVTSTSGIDFIHDNGARGDKLLPETMGSGCAVFDYDADGDQDLLFVNSQPLDNKESAGIEPRATMALYRNDGRGQFDDVTAGSGLDIALNGMGVAVGDYDNDGRVDVFLSALGANRLFRNVSHGKFVEVTADAGVAGESDQWSTGCGWFDYDHDGDLDLFVCNYVMWSAEHDAAQNFRLPGGAPAYGRPQNFAGTFPYLYRNEGNGVFKDVSEQAGIQIRDPATGQPASKSLGVTFNDFDRDGWLDVVVANDTVQNQLFRNRRNGTFEEMGALAGIAFDASGNARGAMGIDSARLHKDDAFGIAIGNFSNEMTALYVSRGGEMQFVDEATAAGLGPRTRKELTFGLFYVDYDLDGRLDLFAANGHLEPDIGNVQPSQRYEQSPQLFWNRGSNAGGEFQLVPGEMCGQDLVRPIVARGASFADFDNDGDLDLLITAAGRAPRLLRNDQNLGNHWLRLKLIGSTCNRDAIGAQVEVELADRTLRRHVMPTRSYLSQVELPLTIGLGTSDQVRSVSIRWPDGTKQVIRGVEVDRTYEITQRSEAELADAASRGSRSTTRLTDSPNNIRPPSKPTQMTAAGRVSCGDYLHLLDHASGNDSTPTVPRPCRGPLCSSVPLGHHAPPPAPVRLVKPDDRAVAGVDYRAPSLQFSCLFGADISLHPRHLADRIFRPPRCC